MLSLSAKVAAVSGVMSALAFRGDQGASPRRALADDSRAASALTYGGPVESPRRKAAPAPLKRTQAPVIRPDPRDRIEPTPLTDTVPSPEPRPLGAALPRPMIEAPVAPRDAAAGVFAAEVMRLAAEADHVDRVWQLYKSECGVRALRQYDFGREWFSIWDRAAEPTIDTPRCGEVLWRLLQDGEGVRRGLQRARAAAQQAVLDPGTELGMLRWHALEWPF